MDKIKSNMHGGNKHFVLGISFVVFSLLVSIVWGFTYAEVLTNIPGTNMPVDPYATTIPPATTTTSTTVFTPPSAPSNLTSNITSTSVSLSWTDNSNNEDKWNVERRLSGSTTWMALNQIMGANITNYTDTTVTIGSVYDYQVQACLSGTGCSPYVILERVNVLMSTNNTSLTNSNTITGINTTTIAVPSAPTSLSTYTTLTSTMTIIPLRWVDNSNNEISFIIERRLSNSGYFVPVMTTGPNITYYTDMNVTKGTSYDYQVKACLSNNLCSSYANLYGVILPVSTTTTIPNTTAPAAPTNLTVRADGNNVVLNWIDNSNNEAGFKIYRGPIWTDIGNVGSNITSFTDIGRGAGTYTYHLNAFNGSNMYSPISNDATVTVGGATTVVNNVNTNNTTTCTGLTLALKDGKTIYNVGDIVSYSWSCIPVGSIGNVSVWLQKPDSSLMSYGYGFGSNSSVVGFGTTNFSLGQYVLKACLGTNCMTTGAIQPATQTFSLVAATTTPSLSPNTTSVSNIPVTTVIPDVIAKSIPNAPSNLSLYGVLTSLSKSISIRWTDNADNEDKFNVERKLSTASSWSYLNLIMGSNMTFYTDNSVVPGVSYDYRVQACLSGVGCSSYSILEKIIIPTVNKIFNPLTTTLNIPVTNTITNPVNTPISTPVTTPATTTVIPKTITTTMPTLPTTVNAPKLPAASNAEPLLPNQPETPTSVSIASNITEIKAPSPLEAPKDIIESVTAILNIIPVPLPETNKEIIPNEVKVEQTVEQIKQEEIQKQEAVKEEIIKQDKIKEEIVQLVYKDTNKDGISDYDSKYVYNMDPVKASPVSTYKGKSINAGEKILLGFDPGKKELAKVVSEEPTTSKTDTIVSAYKVREIALTEKKEVILKGQAMPNSFITIYIYSTPIMVTVKTDSNGEWQYTMDKELENGNHTVYTATVNDTGNIVAKSTPFSFVKTAEAVTLQDIVPVQVAQASEVPKPGFLQTKNIFISIIGVLMLIGITLTLIGLLTKKNTQ